MKHLLLPITIIATILFACNDNNDKPREGYELAKYNSRSYLRTNLGADSANYEEGTWGVVEPRPVEFKSSARYKVYNDSIIWMENRVKLVNDTIMTFTNVKSPDYLIITTRRDRYQQELDAYRAREAEYQRMYDDEPEYDGYWIMHEYRLGGEPHGVYILLGDTMKYTPSGLIYK